MSFGQHGGLNMNEQQPFQTVTTYLAADDCAAAIDFYGRAFGATESYRMMGNGDGDMTKIGHAEIRIGNSVLFLSDEAPEYEAISPKTLGGAGVAFVLDVEDAEAAIQRAVDAGARLVRPIEDAPYGRNGWVLDPYGFRWNIMQGNPDFDPSSMG